MTANKVGRPTDFTDAVKEKLLIAIRKGAPYEIACNYAGISYGCLNNWRHKADDDKMPEFIDFFKQLKEAEGHTALLWLDKIDKAMNDGAWQAAAWKLERRHYKHFSTNAPLIEMDERLSKIEGKEKEEPNESQG